jgi:hypothetical protein
MPSLEIFGALEVLFSYFICWNQFDNWKISAYLEKSKLGRPTSAVHPGCTVRPSSTSIQRTGQLFFPAWCWPSALKPPALDTASIGVVLLRPSPLADRTAPRAPPCALILCTPRRRRPSSVSLRCFPHHRRVPHHASAPCSLCSLQLHLCASAAAAPRRH